MLNDTVNGLNQRFTSAALFVHFIDAWFAVMVYAVTFTRIFTKIRNWKNYKTANALTLRISIIRIYFSWPAVMFVVLSFCHKFKIIYNVIFSVSIFMVNHFIAGKLAAKMLFHDKSMNANVSASLNPFNVISIICKRTFWTPVNALSHGMKLPCLI